MRPTTAIFTVLFVTATASVLAFGDRDTVLKFKSKAWDEFFHKPPAKSFIEPSLTDAQGCLAYAMSVVEHGTYDPTMDEFCGVRGLYPVNLPDYVRG